VPARKHVDELQDAARARRAARRREIAMSAARSLYRIAILGLLLSRAPRSVRVIVGWMMLGVAIVIITAIVFGVTAQGEDAPRYWPSYQSGRSVLDEPPRRQITPCPIDGPGEQDCNRARRERKERKDSK
jgi:hypothetical protein